MKNKWIITSVVSSNIILSLIVFKIGYSISKKKYSPKEVSGEIYIDYTRDKNNPDMYMVDVDPKTFSNNVKFIMLPVNHVRK